MPKPTNKYDVKHLHNLQKLQQKIDDIYKAATKEAAAIGVSVPNFNEDKPFAFDDYPTTKKRIENLLKGFQKSVEACVVNGIDAEWELSNKKNDELAEQVFGRKVRKLTKEQRARYFSSNDSARQAFIARKENGLGLSDRVWRYTKEFKSEIEMGLDLGLREGQSADEMSRDLRQYLQHPDKLFRRVRDEHGMLHLSKQAAAFHPGRGVYRSSYMNARRLAATEGNIAYRTADNERWKEMDFVVGIEVHLSNNHTLKGRDGKPHPFTDICDELQGRYPKDFKFTGWHPNCRCYATSILKTDEEIAADTKKILNGEPVDGRSVNEVKDVPQGFKDWVLNNQERIGGAKSLPYFIKDNQRIVDNIINPAEKLSALDIAKLRHEARTESDIRMIQDRADARAYGDLYVVNVHRIEKALGIKRGKRMTHEEANNGAVNPNFRKSKGYRINCSTCSATYILRRMGFDVEAKPNVWQNTKVVELSRGMTTWDKWLLGRQSYHSTEDWMMKNNIKSMNKTSYMKFLDEYTKEVGIYEFNVGYKGGGGHSTLLERRSDGTLVRIEQQVVAKHYTLASLLIELEKSPHRVRGVMRVDNAMFNENYAQIVKKVARKK